ncbi:hypothetical protein Mag101_05705 [Microbulbifer agarilyticus]|uniref:DUF4198 domain-containing protein n=1 Tax=Microbulbifer agarilyticus TaxID=260552 RepID=A0A1Q2M3G0_9GAMM|nr:hypothetical protein [Microbulbifer agarilyticus]AQQ67189.1 hypothetical protein Mag101_05705 [Microbulbifer agarilyticus]
MKRFIFSFLVWVSATSCGALAESGDFINRIDVPNFVGGNEPLRVDVDLKVAKTRDVYFVLQYFDTWKKIKEKTARVTSSGKYHVNFETDDIDPGKYRVVVYVTPRDQNWNHRVGNEVNANFSVLTESAWNEHLSTEEISEVRWPRRVSTEKEVLGVRYRINTPKVLSLDLVNGNGDLVSNIRYPVAESGDFALPIDDLFGKVGPGRFTWKVLLLAEDGESAVGDEVVYHFTVYGG